MPRTSAPGSLLSSLPQSSVSHQVLTSHFHVLWHLDLSKESQHCTRAAAPAVGWQGPAKPFSHPSQFSAPLVHPGSVRLVFGAWYVSTNTNRGVERGTEGHRPGAAPGRDRGAAGVSLTQLREAAALELSQLCFLQHWHTPVGCFCCYLSMGN